MADTKLHDLTEETSPVSTMEVYGVKSPFGTTDDRRVTLANLKKGIFNTLTSPVNIASVSGGSVLVFPMLQDGARIYIQNLTADLVRMHGWIVDGPTGANADFNISLSSYETISLLHSDLDPGAVSTFIFYVQDSTGYPITAEASVTGWVETVTGSGLIVSNMPAAIFTGTMAASAGTPADATLSFGTDYTPALPTKLSATGFRSAAERDAAVFSIARMDGDLFAGAMGAIGVLTIKQINDGVTTTWTFNPGAGVAGWSGVLADTTPPTLPAPGASCKIQFEGAAGIALLGSVSKFDAGWGDTGGRFTGGSMLVSEASATDTLKVLVSPPISTNRNVCGILTAESGVIADGDLVLGDNLLTTGTFATSGLWTYGTGWTFNTSGADHTGDNAGTLVSTETSAIPTVGCLYQVTFTILNWSDGAVMVSLGGSIAGLYGTSQTIQTYVTAKDTTPLTFTSIGTFTGTIDTVKVEKVMSGFNSIANVLGVGGQIACNALLNKATGAETAFSFSYETNKAAGNDNGMAIFWKDTLSPAGPTGGSFPLSIWSNSNLSRYVPLFHINELGDVKGNRLIATGNPSYSYPALQKRTGSWDAEIYTADGFYVNISSATPATSFRVLGKKLELNAAYTDESNYERIGITAAAGTMTIATETSGTGSDNIDLNLTSSGTGIVKINGNVPVTDVLFRNAVINGTGVIKQRPDFTLVKDVYGFGTDRFQGMATGTATAASAGIFTQTATANCGRTGYAHKFTGVTLSGVGIIYLRHRIESADARIFKNQTASLSFKTYQNTGVAINYTAYLRKADAADVFTAVTAIANSVSASVPNTAATTIKFEGVSMGDCSNGIEIEIKIECGEITTKAFEITEVQLEVGSHSTAFEYRTIPMELSLCRRYYQCFGGGNAYQGLFPASCVGATSAVIMVTFPVQMRVAPVFTSTGNLSILAANDTDVAITNFNGGFNGGIDGGDLYATVAAGIVAGNASRVRTTNDTTARLQFNAEY